MKKLFLLMLLVCPFMAFSQALHLPGSALPSEFKTQSTNVVVSTLSTTNIAKLATKDTTKKPNNAVTNSALTTTTTTTTFNNENSGTGTSAGTTINKYHAKVLNTNFTIPLVRFNFLTNNPKNATNSLVSTSYFNSVGAGINFSWGELDQTLDVAGNSVSVDYYNHFGFQLGFLFAANSSSGSSGTTSATTITNQASNVFAIVGAFSLLNFQIGAGYEFGSLPTGQKRVFGTISYAIPMAVLIDGGYEIIKKTLIPPPSN
jgi:hypothetical protein